MKSTVRDDERVAGATPVDGLPAWASRHLAEADRLPLASVADIPSTGPNTGRHRVGASRRGRARDTGRLRGWALATGAVAAAVGTVPMAFAALSRDEAPMPQIGTFPVVSPGDLAAAEGGGVRDGGAGGAARDEAVTALPPLTDEGPEVVPTAQNRPLPSSARADARPPARPAARPTAPPARRAPAARVTTARPVPTSTPPAPDQDVVDDVAPREETTTSSRPPRSRPAPEQEGGQQPGLVGGVVGGVGDTVGGLLR